MTESLLERAKANREIVLLAELGAWLHDLGKLSGRFVESKIDPAYVTADQETLAEAKDEKWRHGDVLDYDHADMPQPVWDFLNAPRAMIIGETSQPFTLSSLVSEHHRGRGGHILELLKQADRNDSGEDEYNAAGVPQSPPAQTATVFGREETLCDGDLERLDAARLELYKNALLPPASDLGGCRWKLWQTLEHTLTQGLGKTQRAANDIRLDQHVWGVASRFKAFVARDLVNPPKDEQGELEIRNRFRLLTVQWDSWEAITPFARLSDVAGRAALLADVRDALRHAIETEYAIGNRIYEDDDGIHFLVADLAWGTELDVLVRQTVNAKSGGELLPVVTLSAPTEHVTLLARQIAEARKVLPIVGTPGWTTTWKGAVQPELCPVCHQRPLSEETSLCDWCAKRRRAGAQQRREQSGTFQTGEIADERGKTALIVARFDLEDWLKGDMLHTLFITSPQDMATVPDDPKEARKTMPVPVKDWCELSHAVSQLPEAYLHPVPDANKIKEQEDLLRNWGKQRKNTPEGQLARWLTAQFGRSQTVGEAAQRIQYEQGIALRDAFLLALVRKNPAAGRLLRVWQTTEAFLQTQAEALRTAVGAKRQRAVLTLRGTAPEEGYYTADLPGLGTTEVLVRSDGKVQTTTYMTSEQIERLHAAATGAPLRLQAGESADTPGGDYTIVQVGKESYFPYQVITVSPNLLLAMVPADRALAIAQEMQAAYAAAFSKVQGRLPFHVGLVFMDAHYPMFAALDAARRFAETFDELVERGRPRMKEIHDAAARDVTEMSDKPGGWWAEAKVKAIETHPAPAGAGKDYTLHVESERFGAWQWRISARLGNDAPDYYHPYVLVKSGAGLAARGMSLQGPYGRWVHVSEVQVGDTVGFLPNLFDFISLDTVSRRLEAHLNPNPEIGDRRPHPLLGARHSPRPYLLERLGDLARVWEDICDVPGMSESRLQAATTLLARKWEAWELAENPDGARAAPYRWLVEKTVAQDFNGSKDIHDAILNGLYFDVIDLYRHILKQAISASETQTKEEDK